MNVSSTICLPRAWKKKRKRERVHEMFTFLTFGLYSFIL